MELHCELGNHPWERTAKPGRAPKSCPDHSGPPKTLRCDLGGHDWPNPGGRGRRPRNCPEHAPKPAAPVPVEPTADERVQRLMERLEAFAGRTREVIDHGVPPEDAPRVWKRRKSGRRGA